MLEEELHFQLLRSFHFSNRAIVAQTSRLQLMPGQPKILLYLLEHDGAMAKEITEGCVLDKSTVTSLLARMAQLGLIVRRPHARDRRAAMTCLTEKGPPRSPRRSMSSVSAAMSGRCAASPYRSSRR